MLVNCRRVFYFFGNSFFMHEKEFIHNGSLFDDKNGLNLGGIDFITIGIDFFNQKNTLHDFGKTFNFSGKILLAGGTIFII